MPNPGTVFLVGAGPGDPGLLTLRGRECLEEAQVVVYDALVDPRVLSWVPSGAERVYVGKRGSQHRLEQDQINALLVQKAQEGKTVVRLKGGDPFVFGRGGEEALYLAEHGIPFEVVPGVTSAVAAPAYAGIPVTHRGIVSAFTVVSGTEAPGKTGSPVRWAHLAASGATLVVLMSWEALPEVVAALQREGMDPQTPAALIQWGTEPYQRVVEGRLAEIVQRGREAGLEPPVAAVFGQVVELRRHLRWFERKPLLGLRVLVTRARQQAGHLSDMLAREGALPIEVPVIEVLSPEDPDPLRKAVQQLQGYAWAVFTSVNGVEALWQELERQGKDARALGGVKVAAIGPATAQALASRGVQADYIPERYLSLEVARGLVGRCGPGRRVLIAQAEGGDPALTRELDAAGVGAERVVAYRTVLPQEGREAAHRLLVEERGVDAVTFTSSSTVRNLLSMLDNRGEALQGLTLACIGPVTAETLRAAGLEPHVVAEEHTVAGLVQGLVQYYRGR